jgi:MFS family permease
LTSLIQYPRPGHISVISAKTRTSSLILFLFLVMAPSSDSTDKRHINRYTLLVVLGISLSFLTYGYAGGVIGTIGGQPSFLKYMNLINGKHATQLFGASNGLFYAGGVFGTFYAGYAADRWGRKNASIQAQIGLIIALAIQTGSVHIAMFIVGRFIAGFA